MLFYSYLNIRFGSVDGIIGFIIVFLTSNTAMVLFLGDSELIPLTAALPVSRKQLVLSKYISTYLFTLLIIVGTSVITWFLASTYIDAQSDLFQLVSLRGFVFAFMPMTIMISISYPLLFKFGFNSGARIVLFAIMISYAVTTVLGDRFFHQFTTPGRKGIFILFMNIFKHFEDSIGKVQFYSLTLTLMVTTLLLSMILSIHFMRTKDIS
jgi:hypothetical protein